MSENSLTKIRCPPAESDFVVLYLRQREHQKSELNLVKLKKAFEIFDHRIRTSLLQTYKEFKELKLSLSDFFNVNILIGKSDRLDNEFTLRKMNFDIEKEVN